MADALERFGVSMEHALLEQLDALIERRGFANRSEALRELARHWITESAAEEDPRREAMGTLTLSYDHTRRDLADKLTHLGHERHHLVLTTLHFHLDHERCLEVLALKGPVGELRGFADAVNGIRGVEQCQLVLTGTSKPAGKRKRAGHSHGPGHWHSHD